MSAALLDVRDLSIGLPGRLLVDRVSLRLAAGETLALVGESGCGKSMTALGVLGLLPPGVRIEAGVIAFEGRDMRRLSPRALRALRGNRLALVPQEPLAALNPVQTVGAQVAEVLRHHQRLSARAARRRVAELFDLVQLPEPQRRLDDFPHHLSGGQRQRVMIAMAVACNPRLLIADEPTTALDVTIQAQILELLGRLRAELGMAMLLITHDLGVVAQWADRVVVMYAGRVVEEAPVTPFFAAPLHPYARGLRAAALGPEGRHARTDRLPEIAGQVGSALGQAGCGFTPRCPRAQATCHLAPPPLEPCGTGRWLACPPAAQEERQRVAALG
ncbi:putative peptide ABC transporter ATP-binding protein y4tR [Rhodovastum atsumiense]|uniref:ABC transporter ATP-binding protein n=1 Tax=Rhodovastum atsumiense TaxID=504468 RepID=A0A5M6IY48_9PROT|nr:ABC transporter ATP-binding protein [Rhodovastum atsumiense]KAA5612747.1 ABC transporter ATP-binding protein [Rhodovastum atsumiense]CAH2602691.1 putative peptide ABC transporter ATP-binding protein y4tR [Rhodovastum atsumiense]